MKSRKRHRTEGIELSNQDKIRMLGEKKTYKYLVILQADTIKHAEMKENVKKIPKEKEKTAGNQSTPQKSHKKKKIFVIYSGPFLKWTREEFQQMNLRTRNLTTMYIALHSRDDIDRWYVPRKGGRRLA